MFSISSLFHKSPTTSAFQSLKVDMHSHLIPGIDDGSPDLTTSLALLGGLQELGFKKVITTPHIYQDIYPNDSKIIRAGLMTLTEAMRVERLDVQVEAAAEYYVDRHFEQLIEANDVLSFGKERYVLIEMSFVSISPAIKDVVFSLVARGYCPILAHPERYTYLAGQLSFYQRLAELGCVLQVNILSLMGHYGKSVQSWANTLLKSGLVVFLGTDLHHTDHLSLLTKCQYSRRIADLIEKHTFKNSDLLG